MTFLRNFLVNSVAIGYPTYAALADQSVYKDSRW